MSYMELRSLVEAKCKKKELVILVENPIKADGLQMINNLFQTYKIWALSLESEFQMRISAFYR